MDKPVVNIFFVISNITQLVTETYLAQNGNSSETIVLHTKRFKPDMQGINLHYYPYFDDRTEFEIAGNNFIKKKAHKKELFSFISTLCKGKNFMLFAPHFYINTLRMIIAHPDCKDYAYIEEGTLSYMGYKDIITGMPERNFNLLQSKGMGFKTRKSYPDLNKTGVCLRENCFPFLKNKLVLENKALESVLKSKESNRNYAYSEQAILVFDSCVENKMASFEDYLLCIIKSIAFIKSQGKKKIFYKFHPDQHLYKLITYYRAYLNTAAFELEFEELPNDLSLELVFLRSKNLLVIHTISSLGYYASMQGHSVFSNATFLLNDKVFKEKYFEPVNSGFNFEMLAFDAN